MADTEMKQKVDAETPSAEPVYVSLHTWAHANVPNPYSPELMGGFYHVQETEKPPHLADTEDGWKKLMEEYKSREVK